MSDHGAKMNPHREVFRRVTWSGYSNESISVHNEDMVEVTEEVPQSTRVEIVSGGFGVGTTLKEIIAVFRERNMVWKPDYSKRSFVCKFHFVGWGCLSLGFHVDVVQKNIELHLPFGFIKVGWETPLIKVDPHSLKR